MKTEQAFGVVLKKYRSNKILSQEKLAHICGLDRTYISLLERGKRNPTILVIFQLADALDIKPSYLISEVEKILEFSELIVDEKNE